MEDLIKALLEHKYNGPYNEAYFRRCSNNWPALSVSASDKNIAITQVNVLLEQNALLAQISESLAILANNTRLIQDKEAVKESI